MVRQIMKKYIAVFLVCLLALFHYLWSEEKKIEINYCEIKIPEVLKQAWYKNNVIKVIFEVSEGGAVKREVVVFPLISKYSIVKEIRESASRCVKGWKFLGYTGLIGQAEWQWSFEQGWHPLWVKIGDTEIIIDANPKDCSRAEVSNGQEQ